MKSGPCSCSRCVKLCLGAPGWFLPGEASAAAKSLGMTFPNFFKRFLGIACWYNVNTNTTLIMSPRTVNDKGNLYGDRERGRCLFLGTNGCKLSYDCRPEECRVSYGCDLRHDDPYALRREIATAWKKLARDGQQANETRTAWDLYTDSLPEVD